MLSRVLVVDDDPLVCELVKEILDSVEMDAVTLTDSKEASTRLRQEKFPSRLSGRAHASSGRHRTRRADAGLGYEPQHTHRCHHQRR